MAVNARLRIVSTTLVELAGQEIVLSDGRTTFGRADDCTVILDEGEVSRHHAAIERTPTGYRVLDTGSRNGVFVDGERVSEAALVHLARVTVGETTFEFVAPPRRPTQDEATLTRSPVRDEETVTRLPILDDATIASPPIPDDATVTARPVEEEPTVTLPPPPFVVRVLESEAAEDRGKTFEVAEGSATLGREDDCTIVLNDAKASRHHARVAASPDGNYRVVDTQSANGVWVDERRVSDEVLSEGQRFRIGSTLLECRRAASAAAPDGESTLRMAGPWRPSSEPTGQRLGEAGEPVEFIGKPFLIDDAAFAYYVVSGKAEIFTITVQGRRPVGARSHFATVDEGHAFFGIDLRNTRGLGFMAQGRAGTVLRRISRNVLSQMTSDGPVAAEIAGLVDAWVASLTAHVVHDILTPPEPACRLETGQSATLPPGVHASVVSGVQWLPVGAQELLFLGTSMLGPDAGSRESFFPLTPESWIEAGGPAEASLTEARPTTALLAAGRLWDSLDAFHDTLCECELINKRLEIVDQFDRLQSKARYAKAAQDAAIDAIESVLPGGERHAHARPAVGSVKPLVAACRLVGECIGIEITSPGESRDARGLDDQVLAIARASRCQTRQVALRGSWWKGDHGPLLAFWLERDTPVALLPTNKRGYTLEDPATGDSQEVTGEVALSLNPFAYSFYRPLPQGKLGAWDLIVFGSRGLTREFRSILGIGILNGLLAAALPYLTGRLVDEAIPAADRGLLVQLGLGMLLIAAAGAAFKVAQSVAVVRVESKMDYALQSALWDRVLSLPAGFFRNYGAGDLSERAAGINAIRGVLWEAGVSGILGALNSVAYLLLMLTYDVRLTAAAIGLTLILVAITTLGNLAQLRYQRTETEQRGKITSLALQLIAGVAKVRVSAAESHAFRVWAQQFSTQKRAGFTTGQLQNVVITALSGFQVLSTLALFAALWYLQSSPGAGGGPALSTGSFIAFFVAFASFGAALQGLSDSSLSLLLVVPLFERLRPILETLPESGPSMLAPGKLRGEISVSNLFFRYGADGPWVVKDVSLTIKPGQFVALVGASGCGKSTMLRLLLGFEQPQSGAVRFDGQDLSSLDIRAVRQQFGVVLQESQVLPTDIFRNIVGSSARTLQDAWQAAEMAGLADDIRQMPMGMNTFVSEGGGTFSGGQRQRLLIARALVNKPSIIFFDEATSALDNRAQAVVTGAMGQLEATRIVIAHRLSTIVNADRIIYLEDGQVREEGTYEELMAKDGAFARLARRQIA